MSKINSSTIDEAYPYANRDNPSDGFRQNFKSIKDNLEIAASEISKLEQNAILKTSLDSTSLDNDMNNELISNAKIRGFRQVVNNLGSNLEGQVKVDVSVANVHIGTVSNNISLVFSKWPPIGTFSELRVLLAFSNPNATLTLPPQVDLNTLSEIQGTDPVSRTIKLPAQESEMHLVFYTLDCGETVYVTTESNFESSRAIKRRTCSPFGLPGDQAGAVAVDDFYLYVCTGSYSATIDQKTASGSTSSGNKLTLDDVFNIQVADPVIFTGTVFGGIVANKFYYVKHVNTSDNTITVSETRSAGSPGTSFSLTNGSGTMIATVYTNGTSIWKRIALESF